MTTAKDNELDPQNKNPKDKKSGWGRSIAILIMSLLVYYHSKDFNALEFAHGQYVALVLISIRLLFPDDFL